MARTSLKGLLSLVREAEKASPIPELFVQQLIKSIEKTANKNTKLPSAHYKPSSMNCIRNMYYQLVQAEPEKDTKSAILVGIGESGTDRHERLQSAIIDMKANGFDCEYIDVAEYIKEQNIKDVIVKGKRGIETQLFNITFNISFLCDGIIKFHGKYYILEIKTETSSKWYKRKDVDPVHYNQATAYSISLGIEDVLFLYENRDNCDKKAYILSVTDSMKQKLICTIQSCDEYVDMCIVPPKPVGVSEKACQYCAYRIRCRGDK